MTLRISKILGLLSLLATCLSCRAEDIDLFIKPVTQNAGVSNVLFIIDNTANWEQPFVNEKAALVKVFQNLPDKAFNIGIMLAAETGKSNNNIQGGYVRAAMREMTATSRGVYANLINSFDVGADKGNSGQASLVMAEAYRYFKGLAPYSGNNKVKADFQGNTGVSAASDAIYALSGNALSGKAATSYNPFPATGSGCPKNFIIYISNGASQDPASIISDATNYLKSVGGDTSQIVLTPSGSQDNVSDEWARYMASSALQVVTYTIDVDRQTNSQGLGWTEVLKSMAKVSSGGYYTVDTTKNQGDDLANAINSILSEIQDVNSAFAATSLPVSVNTQNSYLNQLYIGMFRPDPTRKPRWYGNMKQYKLDDQTLRTVDADGAEAINNKTGFITACARSFWTPKDTDIYWKFRTDLSALGNCLIGGSYSNSPDGNVVEKGAAAQVLRSNGSRIVKTCASRFSDCASLTNFDKLNLDISETLLGVTLADTIATPSITREKLIDWARGIDVKDQNGNQNTTENRPSIHGDVVHSRPLALNFNGNVVVFYGTNDGMLHAVNGNQTNSIVAGANTVPPGGELWSFLAPEFFPNIKRLYNNSELIKYVGDTDGTPKPYGIDGPITADKTADHTWLYVGMRRGGRVLYKFDVTDPGAPALKWKIGCADEAGTTCSTGADNFGQTWSSPKIIRAAGYGSGTSPILLMGGGYDNCEDVDQNPCASGTKGNAIYVIDGTDGSVLKSFPTDRAVTGDITVVPDASGSIKYAYAADLGGNIYRISGESANTPIGASAPDKWTETKIASLGCDAAATTCAPNRKFMFGPDVVVDNGFNILLVGSGDREKPVSNYSATYGVTDYFFMIKDNPADTTWLSSETANCDSQGLICLKSLLNITTDKPSQTQLDAKKGWYLGLAPHEQVVTSAITSSGVVTFSTHQAPVYDTTSCKANLGIANVYSIAYTNAASANGTAQRFQEVAGGGLPPNANEGIVETKYGNKPFCIGCSPDSPLQGGPPPNLPPPPAIVQPKSRVYWYIQQ